jgi:formyl-CoA transferase
VLRFSFRFLCFLCVLLFNSSENVLTAMPPLDSIRVLDLSRVLAGPYCTMMLGDLGAEVIKVERPGTGDDTRAWGPPFIGGESAYYLCCNRNKKSLAVNLKDEAGRKLVADLAERSDVLVENSLPGQLDGWGLGWDMLSKRNPRLVYCSITGFGQTGPRRDEPGYDILIQAMSGVMSITGEADGPPMKLGVAIADITAGMLACNAILAALFARERSGKGERIDIALWDATLAWMANVGQNYLVSGKVPQRHGTAHPNIVPYQAFETADGALIVAVGNDAQFQRFCQAVDRPDLAADRRFAKNADRVRLRETLIPDLAATFRTRLTADWLPRLQQADVPAGPVNSVAEALADPQVAARGLVQPVEHPTIGDLRLIASPLRFGSTLPPPTAPPLLGEHTDEILRDVVGLSLAAVEHLRTTGVVGERSGKA